MPTAPSPRRSPPPPPRPPPPRWRELRRASLPSPAPPQQRPSAPRATSASLSHGLSAPVGDLRGSPTGALTREERARSREWDQADREPPARTTTPRRAT